MKTLGAIISDADGTLVDTVRLIRHGQYETVRTYLQRFEGIAVPSFDEYEPLLAQAIGGSAHDTLRRTVQLICTGTPDVLSRMDFDELHDLLNPIQDKLAAEYVTAYKGLDELLRRVGELNMKFAIVTSGTPHHVMRNFGVSLPQLGLAELYMMKGKSDGAKLAEFEAAVSSHFGIAGFTVVTCDDVRAHKPDPAGIELAMQRLGVEPEQSMVLGDHIVDMQAGRAAGAQECIGVSHGFDDEHTLIRAGATRVIHSLEELTSSLVTL